MTYLNLNSWTDESKGCATNFMCGQSLATCIIALIVLIECIVASIIVYRNIRLTFSLKVIFLVALNAAGNIVNQVLQEPRDEYQTPAMVIGQAVSLVFIMNYVPLSIYFTQRQWFLYKRFLIRNASNSCKRLQH